jgi:hypothetical protein
MSGHLIDYISELRRHASYYNLPMPVYYHIGEEWHCLYHGSSVMMANGNPSEVARVMLILATVNRPMPT